MRKLLFALSAAAGIAAAACAQQRQNMYKETSDNRILIAYFSATGTTARAAERLAEATGGTLYAIVPARPYTPDDLDWHDKRSRSSAEMNDPQARPAIGGRQPDTEDYDTVFIGYPIWWDLAPRIIDTERISVPAPRRPRGRVRRMHRCIEAGSDNFSYVLP